MLSDIISSLSSLGWDVVEGFSNFFIYIKDTTISEFLTIGSFPWTEAIFDWLVNKFGWGDVTLLSLLLGSGLSILVVVTIVKWVIGIVM